MRLLVALAVVFLASCSTPSKPPGPPKSDPATEIWYHQSVEQLRELHGKAEALRGGKPDEAAALLTQSQPLIAKVLGVPRPTLAAMEVASDLDDLYGRMLAANRHYGAARLMFQKNAARWKHWRPQTEETLRRRKLAEEAIAKCDLQMMK